MTVPQAFEHALQHHKAGRLAEAEALYRQILAVHPDHPDALHLLGTMAHQIGRPDLAIEWIRRAIHLNPGFAAAHYNLGNAFREHKRFDEAIAAYRRAVELQPDFADAHHNLGIALKERGQVEEAIAAYRRTLELNPNLFDAHYNLGVAFAERGRLEEAIAAYQGALRLNPNLFAAQNNLGVAFAQRGRLEEAVAAYRRALELQPADAKAHNNLGIALQSRGRLDEAIVAYRRALELQPADAKAHNNLGNALKELGRPEEALAAYRRALQFDPHLATAQYNLGIALREQGQLDEAITAFRRVLEFQPGHVDAHNYLGAALRERGQIDEAIAAFRRALELQPESAETHNNLGLALQDRGRPEEVFAALRRALELKPDFAEAHNNLGIAYKSRGQFDEAVAAFRRALELQPDFAEVRNNLGNTLRDQGQLDAAVAEYRRALELKPAHIQAHSNLAYTLHFLSNERTIAEEHARWNRQFGEPLKGCLAPHPNDRDPVRRLRIGYVSPDLRDHVVGRNLRPLFQHHDRWNFEILCYAGVVQPDHLTEAIRANVQEWRSTVGMADDALAEAIRRDRVDILVDLSQHMAGNRLPVFARHPAPVQVSFAGYPASTGMDTIEYRISDRWLEANCRAAILAAEGGAGGQDGRPTGEHVFLLDSFWCYDPQGMELEVNPLPAQESGRVTFGCLNNFCKVNQAVLRLWARVLQAVPEARLVMLSVVGSHRQRTLEFLESEGVAARRVEFVEMQPRRAYLELYHRLDIALDTFPYNGHTTSLDALWMGVPVVSLAGERAVSRAGLSQLSNLGLPELVTFTEEQFVETATRLACDLPRLAELRKTLRARMEASVLMDAPRFARSIEAAYRRMWHRWCAEKTGP